MFNDSSVKFLFARKWSGFDGRKKTARLNSTKVRFILMFLCLQGCQKGHQKSLPFNGPR